MAVKESFKEKRIFSGKRVLLSTVTVSLFTGMAIGASAANHTWGSQGNVLYKDKVLFSKSDLIYLDNRITSMESEVGDGKNEIAKEVNTWELSDDVVLSETENVTFEEINTALEYIKTIPNAGEKWKSDSGGFYYKKEDGSVTTNSAEAEKDSSGNISAVVVTKATSDHLAAGCRAWVNGKLVTGSGVAVRDAYNKGYTQGVADKLEKSDVEYVYHKHTGSPVTGGGCYTVPAESNTGYTLGCGKTVETIEKAIITY